MVGKPNLIPESAKKTKDPAHAAKPRNRLSIVPDFTPLDEEREESMADEGGYSGAEMEAEDVLPGESLIAVPHFARRESSQEHGEEHSEEHGEEHGGKDDPPIGNSPIENLKDAVLLVGLAVAAGFYLAEKIGSRKRADARRLK